MSALSTSAKALSWHGIFPSLPTPFDSQDVADPHAFRRIVRFAIDGGAHGIVCFGLAGEVGRVTVSERKSLLEEVLGEVGGLVPVLTGATGENLRESRGLLRHAEQAGASGIVVPPPMGYPLSEAEFVEFLVELCADTELPVFVQNAPELLGVGFRPDAIVDAARSAPAIRGVKLESGPEGIELWRSVLGEDYVVFGGNGGLYLLDGLRAGAVGFMPAVDTVDLQVAIYESERTGRHDEADGLFARLLPLLVFEDQTLDHFNACVKYVLWRRGVLTEIELRSPGLRRLSEQSIRRLEAYLRQVGVDTHVGASNE